MSRLYRRDRILADSLNASLREATLNAYLPQSLRAKPFHYSPPPRCRLAILNTSILTRLLLCYHQNLSESLNQKFILSRSLGLDPSDCYSTITVLAEKPAPVPSDRPGARYREEALPVGTGGRVT